MESIEKNIKKRRVGFYLTITYVGYRSRMFGKWG